MNITEQYRQARKGNIDTIVLEGAHAFKHAVRFGAEIVHVALKENSEAKQVLKKFGGESEILELEKYAKIVPNEIWSTLSPNNPATGLIALAKKPIMQKALVGNTAVFLENPNSLFNVGAIIRTLAAAGVASIVVSGRNNPWHADCISTSRGLHFAMKHISHINSINELTALAEHSTYTPYALDTDTDFEIHMLKTDINKKLFMFGTERDGLSEEATTIAKRVVKIPMQKGVSSLNLAASVAVVVYH